MTEQRKRENDGLQTFTSDATQLVLSAGQCSEGFCGNAREPAAALCDLPETVAGFFDRGVRNGLMVKLGDRARFKRGWRAGTLLLAFAMCGLPALAQFAGGVVEVDPTTGAQAVAKFIADGLLYIVAAAAVICFFWGIFQLFRRPLEGILEISLGLTVFYLIGHAFGWASGLTGVQVG